MIDRLRRYALFALYQATLVVGIAMLPLAVALDRVGLTLPMHRLVATLGGALDAAQETPS
jgi:hypothetical protein